MKKCCEKMSGRSEGNFRNYQKVNDKFSLEYQYYLKKLTRDVRMHLIFLLHY